jgi:hypothetical protein
MTRLQTIAASALAVAAIAPATAAADTNALRGAPQMFQVDSDTVQVNFTADKRIARNGARIAIADLGSTRTVRAAGRHGNDFKYVAKVNVDDAMTVGAKYRVRFTLGSGAAASRLVVLREAR